jgi:hypothetical protein
VALGSRAPQRRQKRAFADETCPQTGQLAGFPRSIGRTLRPLFASFYPVLDAREDVVTNVQD